MKYHPFFRVFRRYMSSQTPLLPQPPLSSLRGTVQSHNAYILLHAPPNQPPQTFPPRGPESQVHKRLQGAALKWGGIVNWVWYPSSPSPSCTTVETESTPASPSTTSQDSTAHNTVEDESNDDGENYSVTVFSKNGRLEIPQITLSNLEQVEETIRQFTVDEDYAHSPESVADKNEPDEVHVLICTHMARDCRCGIRGGAFARTMHEQISQREPFLGNGENKVKLRLGEVGHVGGHQYAPNVLIYPFGDWYGVLAPEQVSNILDELDGAVKSNGVRLLGKTEGPLLASVKDHWRGRMGMSKEEQALLAQSLGLGQEQQQREDADVEVVEAKG